VVPSTGLAIAFTTRQPSGNIQTRTTATLSINALSTYIIPSTTEMLNENVSFLSTNTGLGVVVGVAVGAVLFLCVVSVLVAVIVLKTRKRKGSLDIGNPKETGNVFNNAIYMEGM